MTIQVLLYTFCQALRQLSLGSKLPSQLHNLIFLKPRLMSIFWFHARREFPHLGWNWLHSLSLIPTRHCLNHINKHSSSLRIHSLIEGKIAPDEPAILPPLPIVPKSDKRKSFYGTPQPKRLDYSNREWDWERDRDFELMPPPGSHKKEFAAPMDVEQPIDPNEPTYCVCHQVSFGDMIACDNENRKEVGKSLVAVLGKRVRSLEFHRRIYQYNY
ncbi:hypothetical protein SO802_022542 [Lithocarpus litseifolius]|uniref:Uncharacterized protein n=1 Tax=Lithocarpus litseifolius TaxID=425828 RepID=A0AAW2C790_9ROSI